MERGRWGKEHVMIVPGCLDRVAMRVPHRADACSARRRVAVTGKGGAPKAVGYGREARGGRRGSELIAGSSGRCACLGKGRFIRCHVTAG